MEDFGSWRALTPKQFEKLMLRDGGCLHCGEVEAVSPNHRINRGMGGSKILDRPANLVVLCSAMNFMIEMDAAAARSAKEYGWKLERWQVPEEVPVTDLQTGKSFLLDNNWSKVTV
jgi:hypothetical protein